MPLTKAPQLGSLANAAELSFTSIFTSALEVAAPVMLALLITDVAFGMVSRVVPQMNVFSVAFPLKVGVSLLVVAATLPFLGGWMQRPDLHLGRHRAPRLLGPAMADHDKTEKATPKRKHEARKQGHRSPRAPT